MFSDTLPVVSENMLDRMAATPQLSQEALDAMIRWKVGYQSGLDIDELADKIGDRVGRDFQRVPKTSINVDESGLKVWVQQGNSKTTFKNQKMKFD